MGCAVGLANKEAWAGEFGGGDGGAKSNEQDNNQAEHQCKSARQRGGARARRHSFDARWPRGNGHQTERDGPVGVVVVVVGVLVPPPKLVKFACHTVGRGSFQKQHWRQMSTRSQSRLLFSLSLSRFLVRQGLVVANELRLCTAAALQPSYFLPNDCPSDWCT